MNFSRDLSQQVPLFCLSVLLVVLQWWWGLSFLSQEEVIETSISSSGHWQILPKKCLGLLQQSRWAKPCPRFTAPFKTLLICIHILGVKRKGCACDVSLGNACEKTQTSKNCDSTFLIPCGALGDLCQSDVAIVGHRVPLRGKAVLPIPSTCSARRCWFSRCFQRRYKYFQLIETFVLTFITLYKSLWVLSIQFPCHNIMTGHGIIVLLFWL